MISDSFSVVLYPGMRRSCLQNKFFGDYTIDRYAHIHMYIRYRGIDIYRCVCMCMCGVDSYF